MKLTEVFSSLAHGELSQVFIGSHSEGVLEEDNYPALVSHVNLGLADLYKRFHLKEGRTEVLLQAGTYTYSLPEADILKVEQVITDFPWEMGLNDGSDPYAIMTPSARVLRVPAAVVSQDDGLPTELKTSKLTVVYRASHPAITLVGGYINPDAVELELPYSHLIALLYFIASRVHNPIGMQQEFHAGNSWAAKYEHECAKLEALNLRVDQGSQNTRFERNGWV